MREYNHKEIENKWRKRWTDADIYKTKEQKDKPKFYVLDMFPYPSGAGLHVGHPKGYIATDIISRYKKMQGFSVLHPMGWDAFGLPAEQYAIKNKVHPRIATDKNIATFKSQLEKISLNYDWNREISTTDPDFYKWTQWAFIQMFKKGLVYRSEEPINWCPSCKTGLANEDLEGGKCERCGSDIEQKPIPQWIIKITKYADRLLEDLDELDWQEHIKELQRNWIGRSYGAEIDFPIKGKGESIRIFTTRPDTIFGATYMVLAPEHNLVKKWIGEGIIENKEEIENYIQKAKNKSEIDRTDVTKEKTGVEIKGIKAINPARQKAGMDDVEIPIFIADYVLSHYGTGAIMAVPAHDERDFDFAQKYSLPIVQVIDCGEVPCTGPGKLINSESFNDKNSEELKEKITEYVDGKMTKTYRLRDWVFARQRYWGEPIPLIYCENCAKKDTGTNPNAGWHPVPEKDLPLTLPEVESYEPTGTGESPLAGISEWVNTKCPVCGAPAKRETNTMPQWAGSSWYYLRYIDPHNNDELVNKEKEKYWSPVDFYVGGAEHATRHLIYARFWHKFLYDIGVVNYKEPFQKLQTVGLIMAEDGRKMSKRWGNVINPDEIIENYGADTLRVYEMFMGPFDQAVAWSMDGLMGPRRFLERVFTLAEKLSEHSDEKLEKLLHKTIKKVSFDIENMKYNTAIAQMMVFAREAEKSNISKNDFIKFLKILSPFAPHITQELWEELDNPDFIMENEWPEFDEKKAKDEEITIGVQVNGKVRAEISLTPETTEEKARALAIEAVSEFVKDKEIKRFIYVPGKIVSIVV